ncbi:unnamed protein product, partial [Prorocentrum cordatum]
RDICVPRVDRKGVRRPVDPWGCVPEPSEGVDRLLCPPAELFSMSFESLPHLSLLLSYRVCYEQAQASVASLDMLDPRLATRMTRSDKVLSSPVWNAVTSGARGALARVKLYEDWAGTTFFCPLTKMCTATVAGSGGWVDLTL